MKLSELVKELPATQIKGDCEVLSLCTDSRVACAGDLFFCYKGTQGDSHEFAEEAVKNGASAIVCERETDVNCPQVVVPDGREAMARVSAAFYHHPERKLKIVGVTGTNGKTTVSHMLFSILTEAGIKAGLIGTLGAQYGCKKVAPALTTPDPVFLFSILADMLKEGITHVVMEVSAHALYLKKDCPITYEVGIFTNLTQDHLDFFGNMKAYGEAKKLLFTPARCRFAVLNADDAFSKKLAQGGMPYLTYGLNEPADAFAVVDSDSIRGSRVLINVEDELCEAEISMTGRHNISNALAAAVAAKRLGIDCSSVSRGLAAVKGVDGRLEWTACFRGADVFVDFAHTPDGLCKSLSALKEYCTGRLICLFGCGGNRDASKRKIMGETAARLCDFCVITSDNPRFEDPCDIIAQIEQGFKGAAPYVAIEERAKATEYALGMLAEGDVLLVAGKGGETYQEIMGIKHAYNDKAVIKSIIGKMQS